MGVVFGFGWLSDKTNARGACVVAAQALYLLALIIARALHPHVGQWSRWGLWTFVNACAIGYHPVHNSWVQLNCKDPRERSVSIAMWVMSAISGLMVGTQYYRGDDTPFYRRGLMIQTIMVAVGMVLAGVQVWVYVGYNKRVTKRWSEGGGEKPWLYTP